MKHLILSLLFIISIFSASAFAQCTEGNCENGQGTYKYSDGAKSIDIKDTMICTLKSVKS
jgi:hypothetical protein